nr:hypothetical protein [Tanacetum cinerariifolium]
WQPTGDDGEVGRWRPTRVVVFAMDLVVMLARGGSERLWMAKIFSSGDARIVERNERDVCEVGACYEKEPKMDVLRVDNFIQNSEHEYSESEDSDFDNPPIPLPPSEPPDKEFDFEINLGNEILVVRSVIVKFECIDARVKFDVFNDENDGLSYFMFVIFAKEFSLLSAENEDTIFDPGISE